jgi:hypothetical protein
MLEEGAVHGSCLYHIEYGFSNTKVLVRDTPERRVLDGRGNRSASSNVSSADAYMENMRAKNTREPAGTLYTSEDGRDEHGIKCIVGEAAKDHGVLLLCRRSGSLQS